MSSRFVPCDNRAGHDCSESAIVEAAPKSIEGMGIAWYTMELGEDSAAAKTHIPKSHGSEVTAASVSPSTDGGCGDRQASTNDGFCELSTVHGSNSDITMPARGDEDCALTLLPPASRVAPVGTDMDDRGHAAEVWMKQQHDRQRQFELSEYDDFQVHVPKSPALYRSAPEQRSHGEKQPQPPSVFTRLYQHAAQRGERRQSAARAQNQKTVHDPKIVRDSTGRPFPTRCRSADPPSTVCSQVSDQQNKLVSDLLYCDALDRRVRRCYMEAQERQRVDNDSRLGCQVNSRSRKYFCRKVENEVSAAFDLVTSGAGQLERPMLDCFLAHLGCLPVASVTASVHAQPSALSDAFWRHLDPGNSGRTDLLTMTCFFLVVLGVDLELPACNGTNEAEFESETEALSGLLARFNAKELRLEFGSLYTHWMHNKAHSTSPEPRAVSSPPEVCTRSRRLAERSRERGTPIDQHLAVWRKNADAKMDMRRVQLAKQEVQGCTFHPQILQRTLHGNTCSSNQNDCTTGVANDLAATLSSSVLSDNDFMRTLPRHEALFSKAQQQQQNAESRALLESKRRAMNEASGCTFRPNTAKSQRSFRQGEHKHSNHALGQSQRCERQSPLSATFTMFGGSASVYGFVEHKDRSRVGARRHLQSSDMSQDRLARLQPLQNFDLWGVQKSDQTPWRPVVLPYEAHCSGDKLLRVPTRNSVRHLQTGRRGAVHGSPRKTFGATFDLLQDPTLQNAGSPAENDEATTSPLSETNCLSLAGDGTSNASVSEVSSTGSRRAQHDDDSASSTSQHLDGHSTARLLGIGLGGLKGYNPGLVFMKVDSGKTDFTVGRLEPVLAGGATSAGGLLLSVEVQRTGHLVEVIEFRESDQWQTANAAADFAVMRGLGPAVAESLNQLLVERFEEFKARPRHFVQMDLTVDPTKPQCKESTPGSRRGSMSARSSSLQRRRTISFASLASQSPRSGSFSPELRTTSLRRSSTAAVFNHAPIAGAPTFFCGRRASRGDNSMLGNS